MIDFDILITNFIDYDINLNIDSNDKIYYYATAIKKNDNNYIVVKNDINIEAITIMKLAKANNIYITEDPPLTRALYMQVEEMEEIPKLFKKVLDKIYTKL